VTTNFRGEGRAVLMREGKKNLQWGENVPADRVSAKSGDGPKGVNETKCLRFPGRRRELSWSGKKSHTAARTCSPIVAKRAKGEGR